MHLATVLEASLGSARLDRRRVPRVVVDSAPTVRLDGNHGPQTARLRDASPWGLGLQGVSGPAPAVGARLQVAFGIGRWAIRRVAEVRQRQNDGLGLALTEPLPTELRRHLLDLRIPQLQPYEPPQANSPILRRYWRNSAEEVVGRISLSPWGPHAWLVSELSTRPLDADALDCARDLYRFAATATAYAEGETAHLIAFYELEDPWHDRFTARFTGWLNDETAAVSVTIARAGLTGDVSPNGLTIAAGDPDQCIRWSPWITAAFDTGLPPLICHALGWDNLAARFAEPQPLRPWSVFEVRSGRAEGFLLVERSAPWAHRLTDIIWLIPAPGGRVAALLEAAETVSATCGVDRAALACLPDIPQVEDQARFSIPIGLTVWSAAGLGQFDQYLASLLDQTSIS